MPRLHLALASGCSSQEEHVLKRRIFVIELPAAGCSSQEEHVLKLESGERGLAERLLLLARGACIETFTTLRNSTRQTVAPRKRSMY